MSPPAHDKALPRRTAEQRTNALGRALIVLGDHRNLSIIRAAFEGTRRYGDWQEQLGVSPPVLAGRLRALVEEGILARHEYQTQPVRHEYRLTEAGRDLWPIFVALWYWELRWSRTPDARPALIHQTCGRATHPLVGCRHCPALGVTAFDTSARYDDPFAAASPPRRYRRAARADDIDRDHSAMSAIDLLGDRWSTSLLAAAFLGAHRFRDFQAQLATIPPLMLSDRLDTFVKQQVLDRVPQGPDAKRMEYHLAPKGLDFFPVLTAIVAWTNHWLADPDHPPIVVRHELCGQPFAPTWVCNVCGERLERRQIAFASPPAAEPQ